jgi:di/tricarboxylate transporter
MKLLVEWLAQHTQALGPYAVFIMICLVTTTLTEFMSNNATAVLMTPIAIGLAQSLGVDTRPFLVGIMFMASASFATPIGYQTNTYVFNAGNYRFNDFLKVGIPMNIVVLVTVCTIVPMLWEF